MHIPDYQSFPSLTRVRSFVAIGCDNYAVILGKSEQNVTTGCLSACGSEDSVSDGSCLGIECCQTSIPKGVLNYNVSVRSYNNHAGILDFNPCSYSFLAEEASFHFSEDNLRNFSRTHFPAVLDWALGKEKCEEAMKNSSVYGCKSSISTFYESDNGPGYRCNCSAGYQGNPYLANGCERSLFRTEVLKSERGRDAYNEGSSMELEGLRVMGKHPWVNAEMIKSEETEYLLGNGESSDIFGHGV